MIQAYPEHPSLRTGETLTLHVSTDAPRFRVDLYRFGGELALKERSGWLPGCNFPQHLPYQDWGRPNRGLDGEELAPWPAYDFPIPPDWPSGVTYASSFQRSLLS